MDKEKKVILLAGPTASGKSKLAIILAKKLNGEIINADSMQVYKQLKILTARPNSNEKKGIKHHLYGIIDVNKNFSREKLINTEKVCTEVLSLPMYPEISYQEQVYVSENLNIILKNCINELQICA